MSQLKIEGKAFILSCIRHLLDSKDIKDDLVQKFREIHSTNNTTRREVEMLQLLSKYYEANSPAIDAAIVYSIYAQLIEDCITLLKEEVA